jgi:Bacterial protein of unknown function (DUF916)
MVALVAGAAVFLGALHATAQQTGAGRQGVDFVVQPARGPETSNGYFVIDTAPGKHVHQSVLLRNDSERALELRLAAVDAATGTYGGASYALPDGTPHLTGSWISLEDRSVELGPGQATTVGFALDVPEDAAGGQHLAGLAVWSPSDRSGDAKEGGSSIRVQTRSIVAVEVDLPGSSQPHLTISGIEPLVRADGLYLGIHVANDGHGLTTGEGTAEVTGDGFVSSFSVDTFVPQTDITYPVKWRKSAADGDYDAAVKIRYDDGRVATWQGTFTIGSEVQEGLAERGIDSGGGWPLPIVVALAAGPLLLVAVLWWWRKKRQGPAVSEQLTKQETDVRVGSA